MSSTGPGSVDEGSLLKDLLRREDTIHNLNREIESLQSHCATLQKKSKALEEKYFDEVRTSQNLETELREVGKIVSIIQS